MRSPANGPVIITRVIATTDLCDEYPAVKVLDPILQHFGGRTEFAGPIRTVRVFEDNVLVREALDTIDAGEVLVVDGGGSRRHALVGDRLAQIAVDRLLAGLVIYGAVRDSSALAELDVGVMALGTCPRRSRKDGTGARDEEVGFGGISFSSGDLLIADRDGVVLAPRGLGLTSALELTSM